MSQLRNLRLVRGISLADLKSTCDAGGDVKLAKDDLLKILLRVAWHILAHKFLTSQCGIVPGFSCLMCFKLSCLIVASSFPQK